MPDFGAGLQDRFDELIDRYATSVVKLYNQNIVLGAADNEADETMVAHATHSSINAYIRPLTAGQVQRAYGIGSEVTTQIILPSAVAGAVVDGKSGVKVISGFAVGRKFRLVRSRQLPTRTMDCGATETDLTMA